MAWKMSVEAISLQADIGTRAIGYWENGTYEPKLAMVERVADVLGYELVLRPKK